MVSDKTDQELILQWLLPWQEQSGCVTSMLAISSFLIYSPPTETKNDLMDKGFQTFAV
jgi:hypothetical protein